MKVFCVQSWYMQKYRSRKIRPPRARYFHGGNYTKSVFQYGNISFLKGLGGEKLHKAKSENMGYCNGRNFLNYFL